MNNRRDL